MSTSNDQNPPDPTSPEGTEASPPVPSESASQQPSDQLASQDLDGLDPASEGPASPAVSSPAGDAGPATPPEVTFVEDLPDPEDIWELEGGVRNTAPNVKGKRRVIRGNPMDKKHGRRMTEELYNSIWEAWRDGTRNKTRLCEIFTISWPTLSRVLDKGYPKQGWRAVKERAEQWDRDELQAKRTAAAMAEVINSDEFKKARKENLDLARGERAVIQHLVGRAIELAKRGGLKFTKTKKVKDKQGNLIEIEVEPTAFEMAEAMKTLVSASKELGQHESLWLGSATDRVENVNTGPPKGWAQLAPEQLQWIVDHGGELPPGLTEEMLRDGIPPHVLASFDPTPPASAPAGPKN